jgi:IS30 family transposase
VHHEVAYHGGIAPPERKRSERHLSLAERETISRGVARGCSIRGIAAELERAPSTISREVRRNGGPAAYRAAAADERAWFEGQRYKFCKMALNCRLLDAVARKLRLQWSPEQIAGWLKRRYPDNAKMHVSHETIYRSLFMQTRGILRDELKAELSTHLRRHRIMRRSRLASDGGGRKGPISDGVSIRERPAEAEDRAVPGHWEGDLLVGDRNSYIATLVERASRFVMLVKVDSKDSATVVKAVAKQIRKLPAELRRSLTWDRGAEMARHKEFTIATDLQVYFCDPHSPWQRGSNENTNGLLRQYFPKGHSLEEYPQTYLNMVSRRLNGRPRKTLEFKTPAESLSEFVAMTG